MRYAALYGGGGPAEIPIRSMTTYLIHGMVADWAPNLAACRLYVPTSALERHLRTAKPYVGWRASDPDGDVLTVDDATVAAAEACILARRLGHEVTLFVNPYHVETGTPYFFNTLGCYLDVRTRNAVQVGNEHCDLTSIAGMKRFWMAARKMLMVLPPEDTVTVLADLARRLGSGNPPLPSFARPLRSKDLKHLAELGVRIENHGWSHQAVDTMGDAVFNEDLTKSRRWLRENLGITSQLYAVPFGCPNLSPGKRDQVGDYLLADQNLPPGQLRAGGWNRISLTIALQGS
jgi:hypothetical protein